VHFHVLESWEAGDKKSVARRRGRRYFTPADASVSASFLSLPFRISFWELACMPAISCADFPESVTDSLHLDPTSHAGDSMAWSNPENAMLFILGKICGTVHGVGSCCNLSHRLDQTERDGGNGDFRGRKGSACSQTPCRAPTCGCEQIEFEIPYSDCILDLAKGRVVGNVYRVLCFPLNHHQLHPSTLITHNHKI